MKKTAALAFAFWSASMPMVFAAGICRDAAGLPKPGAERPVVAGNFHYSKDRGLACAIEQSTGKAMVQHEQPVNYVSCLKAGAAAVGERRSKIEALLGAPAAITALDDHTESRAYVIPQKGMPLPHYVVTYVDDVSVAVQLMGPPTVMPAMFSGLSLGDDAQQVVDALGPPAKRCRIGVDGLETWVWGAFPIGIDMLDGYAAGFKVTWPTKQTPG